MKAIELRGLAGPASLELVEIERPTPGPSEVLIEIKVAGVNFADVEITRGAYPASKPLPYVLGFEAAGVVVEKGADVDSIAVGDRVVAITSAGGYAEYVAVDAGSVIVIPDRLAFDAATAIVIQGVTAYALLKYAARVEGKDSVLIQAAAGGVGLFLVQLARILGVRQIIALAGSAEKLRLVERLGADVAIDYRRAGWDERVRDVTAGRGVDVVFEAVAGEIGELSSKLLAPFGRTVLFGARNAKESLSAERIGRLIYDGQTVVGFHMRNLRPEEFAESIANLFALAAQGRLQVFAGNAFWLGQAREALEALADRTTIGKVVLVP